MRILHLLSNWKWTERAEPAADIALAQQEAGAEVVFACASPPGPQPGDAASRAREKGIRRVEALTIPKHFSPSTAARGSRDLKELLGSFPADIVHAHMTNAHLLASLAGCGGPGRPLVRSLYEPDGPCGDLRSRILLRGKTDGLVVLTDRARMAAVRLHRVPFDRIRIAEPGIDVKRFGKTVDREAARQSLGLPRDKFIIGLVSRIREARRIDLAIDALWGLLHSGIAAHLLVVGRGRGDAVERLVLAPSRAAGIADNVTVAGYCAGDRLVEAYSAMDALVYPIHGTDPSCRTVREALAAGVPVVAPRIGFVPELVDHGRTGFVVNANAIEIAGKLAVLAGDRSLRDRMSASAGETARVRFDPSVSARSVMALYDYLLCGAGRDQTDFTVVRRGRVTWRVRRDLAGTIPAAVPDFPGAGDIIQSRKGRTCFRMPGRGGSALVVKRHRPRHWIEAPKYLIARTRACAEWRNAVAFAESGVSTARVLALGETRRLGFWTGSELVMEGVFPGSSLTAMLENGAPAAAIRPVLEKLAVQVARVHDAGFHHRDLHGGNVLVRTDANPGKPALYLVDLHEARRLKEAGRSVSVDDLGRLNSSVKLPPKLRLAFLGRYMECRGWPAHERNSLAREIDARSRAIWARHLQKHGTHIEQYE